MIMSCLLLTAQAQTVTVTTAGGDLATKLDAQGITAATAVTELKISGTLHAADFATLASATYGFKGKLTSIDMSGVTAIADRTLPADAFRDFALVSSLILPQNAITTVGDWAFGWTTALLSLELPESIATLGNRVFQQSGLVEFVLPNSVTSIGTYTFMECPNLKKVTLSNQLKVIPDHTFGRCVNLEEVIIPEGVTTIERTAFFGYVGNDFASVKPLSMTLPQSLTLIDGYNLFYGSGITSVTLPSGVEYVPAVASNGQAIRDEAEREMKKKWISAAMFLGASRLVSVVLPDDITGIDAGAFAYTALTSVTFPESLTAFGTYSQLSSWGSGAFKATQLVDVVIPDNVTDLGSNTFQDITTLKSITLGEKLDKIGPYALAGNTALETIILKTDWPPILGTQALQGIPASVVIYVPDADAVTAYKQADGWKDFANYKIIGEDGEQGEINNFSDLTVATGSEAITLHATATGDRPVTYEIEDGKDAVATLSGNVLTIVGEGTATITAKAAASIDFQASTKTITLTVIDISWLEEATILVSGNSAKVVGPTAKVANFTKFYIGADEVSDFDNTAGADLSEKTGELVLKATNADGSEVIKLKINKQ